MSRTDGEGDAPGRRTVSDASDAQPERAVSNRSGAQPGLAVSNRSGAQPGLAVSNGSDALARRTADAVARRSYGKLVAFLSARTRDVAGAEDALSDAFASALAEWPAKGCPANPEAWLLTVARRKRIDRARHVRTTERAEPELRLLAGELDRAAEEEVIPDQRLALLFACAHPAVDAGIRAPLMLQVVLGLDAAMIASAFLMSPASMGQRLVRAKNKIRQAGIPFRVPERDELPPRLDTVLEAIYAAYAEGWSDPAGSDAARRELAGEALFLCRIVTELMPDEPEALSLLALMLHADARRPARRNSRGDYVPLAEQDTTLWDLAMINEAEALVRRAGAQPVLGRFQLEAALQSAHVHRRLTGHANWGDVLSLYDALLALSGSPVVAINRALALAEVQGAAAALAALEGLASDQRLAQYQPFWAARAEFLARTGDRVAAGQAYDVAIGLERDPAVRRYLLQRQVALLDS